MIGFLIPMYIWLCLAVPIALVASVFLLTDSATVKIIWALLSPAVLVLSFLFVAGLLSRTGLHAIKPGKFDRSLKDPVYGPRRLYATCWTLIYYCTPLYYIFLVVPTLKHVMLRLFGYKGSTDFTIYPDTWVRDLPCLEVGSGSYLSNKATVATNICLMNNKLLVDSIQIGQKSCIGHGALIGPGTTLGNDTEIATNVTSAVRIQYGDQVLIGECAGIQHGTTIGNNSSIGKAAILGIRVKIGDNIKIPDCSHIHTGTRIRTQEEANLYFSEETAALTLSKGRALQRAIKGSQAFPSHLETSESHGVGSEFFRQTSAAGSSNESISRVRVAHSSVTNEVTLEELSTSHDEYLRKNSGR